MNDLQMSPTQVDKMIKIEDLSMDAIKNALENGVQDGDEQVKVAVKMMGVVAKNRQTLSHRTAVDFAMATSIATEKQLMRYVTATSPEIKKALGGKTN